MTLTAQAVSWRRGGNLVVDDVTLAPERGETVGLLGPNGSGKSSLLRLLQASSTPDRGRVTLDGVDLAALGRRTIARRVASVSQHAHTETDLTVSDVVRLGRTPYRSLWGGLSTADESAIDAALDYVGLTDKVDCAWQELSGGEQQRAHIARALAQEPRELLLDEPTNHLDIRHQLELLRLVSRLDVTCVIALHDLNLAAMFCDSVLVLDHGRAVAGGRPADVLTPERIRSVYGVDVEVAIDPSTGRPRISYLV